MKLKLRLSRWPSWLLSVSTVMTLTSLLLIDSIQSIRIRDGGSSRDLYEESPPQQNYYRRKPADTLANEPTSPPSPTDLLIHYYGHSPGGGRTIIKPKPKTVILSRPEYQPVLRSRGQVDHVEVDDDEVEDETDYNYEQDPAETTTVRIQPQIPQALRRNFAHHLRSSSSSERGVTTTLETPTEVYTLVQLVQDEDSSPSPPPVKSSRKKNKTKNSSSSGGSSRRRKVKRPLKTKKDAVTASALTATPSPEVDLEDKTSGGSSNATSEKNLALEIGSDDGKYALIDSFFNQTAVQQPGIISYRPSDDFAKDNEKTLGNLNQNEIWLSDGHLLVLKGGEFDATNKEVWPPIDNYQRRKKPPPLKIPLDTNNPPPFPVFVNDSGPPIFLREPPPFLPYPPPGFEGNGSNFDPSLLPPPGLIQLNPNGTIPQGLGFPPGFGPLSGPPGGGGLYGPNGGGGGGVYGGVNGNGGQGVNQGNYGGPPGGGPNKNGQGGPPPFYPFLPPPGNNNGSFPPPPFPFPPPGGNNQNFPPPPPGYNQNFNGSGPPPGFPFLPPLVLNPADNETDDPSIFLPPPYDFDYYEDNSTLVPPGPFAPGLVVPPPKDFYSVYNRTGRPPTTLFFPTTAIPTTIQVTAPLPKTKQRPNGKKPKFPITNPPDDSLEELYPITTPIPDIFTTTKKRKQRPPKTKKPFFPTDGNSSPSFESGRFNSQESEEVTPQNEPIHPQPPPPSTPSLIFPAYKNTQSFNTSPRPNLLSTVFPIEIIPTYRAKSAPPPPSTTVSSSTTPATPKPVVNSFVYVQGRLTTLEEIAAEQAAEEEFDPNHGPSSARPPFDSRGYPTRVLDENTGEPIVFDFPKKNGRKPTETPIKTYYQGTPKYDPNYVSPYTGTGKIINQNQGQTHSTDDGIQYTNQGPILLQQGNPSRGQVIQNQQTPPTILYPSTVYTNGNNGNGNRNVRIRNRNRNQNIPRVNQNGPDYINPNQNGYYGGGNLVNIGPTYVTQTQEQQPPQSQINFVEKQNQYPNNNNRANVIIQNNPPNYLPPTTQLVTNSGFRPALPPPQQPQQLYNNNQQQQRRPNTRARVLFPGQVSLQQLNPNQQQQQQFNPNPSRVPLYSHSQRIPQDERQQQRPQSQKVPRPTLKTFAPQGYYSPITNYQVEPTPTYGTFLPSQFYGQQGQQQGNNRNGDNQYSNYPAPVSVSNFQSDPTIPSTNYNIHGDNLQVYQPNYQQSNNQNNPAYAPQRLNTQQFIQPLYDDLRINYREPIPQYNEESESVTTRSVLKAGPGIIGDRITAGSSPGTFYSFQRGGVGGFSYKIRL